MIQSFPAAGKPAAHNNILNFKFLTKNGIIYTSLHFHSAVLFHMHALS